METRIDVYETLCPQQMLVHKGGKIKNWGGECRDVTTTIAVSKYQGRCEENSKKKIFFFLGGGGGGGGGSGQGGRGDVPGGGGGGHKVNVNKELKFL